MGLCSLGMGSGHHGQKQRPDEEYDGSGRVMKRREGKGIGKGPCFLCLLRFPLNLSFLSRSICLLGILLFLTLD